MEDQVENYDLMIGYIYRISHLDSDICYIGSTLKPIRNRYHEHLLAYKKWLNGGKLYSIYPYFKQYGVKRFKISLVKEYEVIDSRHLQMYEQLWIEKSRKTCINIANSFAIKFLTDKAYDDKRKEKAKIRYEANKDKIKASYDKEERKVRYEANKEKAKAYSKAYKEANKEANKDTKKEKAKAYYEANKEKSKAYYEANKEAILKQQKESRAAKKLLKASKNP